MLVEVIARNSPNIIWNVSLDGNPVSHEQIRRVSIDKFYELVTDRKTAFKDLCEKLPIVNELNTVFEELRQISPNLLKSLYLLSFERYEGFNNFNV